MQVPTLARWGLKVSGLSALVSAGEKRLPERAAVGIGRVNAQRNKPSARHTVLYNECRGQFLLLFFFVLLLDAGLGLGSWELNQGPGACWVNTRPLSYIPNP